MKIYFTASLTGKKQYAANYKAITEIIEKTGNKLLTDNILKKSPQDVINEKDEDAAKYYKQMVKWIKQADIVIAEVSHSSLGVGHEITLALQGGKPVIALHVWGKPPYLLESIEDDNLQVIDYEIDALKDTLTDAINYTRDLIDVRFNFFVPPKIVTYLDWIAKKERMPRAVYLRKLIEKDMEENSEYTEEFGQ